MITKWICILVVLATFRIASAHACNERGDEAPAIDKLIENAPPWRSDRVLTVKEWNRLLASAAALQKLDKKTAEQCIYKFDLYSRKVKPDGISEECSKGFLLLRLVFNVPSGESALIQRRWQGNEKHSLAWPFEFSANGNTTMVDLYQGSRGEYWMLFDYRELRQHYKFRDLNTLRYQASPEKEQE